MATPSTDVFEEAPHKLNEDPLISLEIIAEAIDNIRDTHKRPDNESISSHLAKTGVLSDIISARTVSTRLRHLEKHGLITNKPTKEGESYFVAINRRMGRQLPKIMKTN